MNTSHVRVLDRSLSVVLDVGDIDISLQSFACCDDTIVGVAEGGVFRVQLAAGARPERLLALDGGHDIVAFGDEFLVATSSGTRIVSADGSDRLIDARPATWIDVGSGRVVVVNPDGVAVFAR